MRDRPNFRPAAQRSPRREAINSQLDEHSNRIKELLRADLIMLEEENAILKAKCKKVAELEDKVEMILQQNTQLLGQNQRLSKLLHQKKGEIQVLKDKWEVQQAQKMGYAAQFDFEKKKLINEITQLESDLKEIEHLKNVQLNQAKSQYQIELQSLKRQTTSTSQIYEQEIRKLREQLDKRDYELTQSLARLKRISSESEYEIVRLKEEKEKLRNQLQYVESDRKKELDSLRLKLQTNYVDEIQSIKRNHLANLDGFESENIKLKSLLESKNGDNEQLIYKLSKQKASADEAVSILKRQNDSLRLKCLELQKIIDNEKDNLRMKISKVHQSEIDELRVNHQRYIECLQSEIIKLQGTIGKKNIEIQQLVKQKSSVRHIFDSEGNRLKDEIQNLNFKLRDLQGKLLDTSAAYEEKLKQKDKNIEYLDKLNEDQQINAQNQIKSLRQIIDHKKAELESESFKFRQKEQQFKETLDEYKNQNITLKETVTKIKNEKERAVQDSQYELQGVISQLKTKVETITSKNIILQREILSLRDTITSKDKQIKALQERIRVSEERQKKLERQNDDLRSKLIKKDQKTNEMLNEQKQRLQTTFAFTLDNLKIDHQSALKLEANRQSDLNEKLRRKQKELDDLLRQYKKMRDEMQVLTDQEANKKELTLKYPGATADLIATKNLFDVYLKARVLDICGDAIGKENEGERK